MKFFESWFLVACWTYYDIKQAIKDKGRTIYYRWRHRYLKATGQWPWV